MSNQAMICIVETQVQAMNVINELRNAGFSADDISLLLPDKTGAHDLVYEKHTKAPEVAAQGAGAGGLLGSALGWLVGVGSLAIPGLGPFIAAGPIVTVLSGIAVGVTVGGLTGSLIGMGIPEYEARQYEGKIREGGILISVHVNGRDQRNRVKEIFTRARANAIAITPEAVHR